MTKFLSTALALAASSMLMAAAPLTVHAAERTPTHGAAKALNATDRDFITTTAAGLKFEAAAAKLAQANGSRDLVKSLGAKDEGFVQRLEKGLKTLAEKKSVALPTEPTREQAAKLAKLENLKGEAFDKAFVEQAGSAYHFDVVNAYKRTAERSVDVDVRGFARTWLDEVNQRFMMINSATSDIAPEALKPSPDTSPRRGDGPRSDMQRDPQTGKAKE